MENQRRTQRGRQPPSNNTDRVKYYREILPLDVKYDWIIPALPPLDEDNCPMCLEAYATLRPENPCDAPTSQCTAIQIQPCGYIVGRECFRVWATTSRLNETKPASCPLCRQRVSTSKVLERRWRNTIRGFTNGMWFEMLDEAVAEYSLNILCREFCPRVLEAETKRRCAFYEGQFKIVDVLKSCVITFAALYAVLGVVLIPLMLILDGGITIGFLSMWITGYGVPGFGWEAHFTFCLIMWIWTQIIITLNLLAFGFIMVGIFITSRFKLDDSNKSDGVVQQVSES
ncbi:hypothetical protein BDV96DRAFT_644622 [Lophiotrema nucula]|uniref:RING-type domain-containing protein n=1 Tax=Lophiotrema nucula TaxID=690887 RepID=A0A6A5ZFJ5_9PLEO|nr:hypothetical protein BDV96DRAFT_644622 [Lophiotrema nucula]